jgi:eukaryotic-like serine/threonine-protein kinase
MTPPATIGHYRITSKLGEGGMGAVYRATDTKLNRDVALKVLPPAFAEDTSRMQRFEREAQLLASLNHPNIACIYGIEQSAIVMELVDGPDLSGPVPVDTAIAWARQIAAGLEAAHERGIIHRDLKPANIKVTPDGTVKLLDFGLAKATEQSASIVAGANLTMSPTLSLAMTQAGMILGTAAYMSPEQARGYPVDRRADIWAFGVVLFELLTGRDLYGGGATVTDTLAAVVLKDPDYSTLPGDTPPRVRRLIQRCLRKDPKQRLRDIGEARLILDEDEPAAIAAAPQSRAAWLPWTVAGAALLIAAVATSSAWLRTNPPGPPAAAARFPLTMPEGTRESGAVAAPQVVPSPDGHYIAFIAEDQARRLSSLWIRPIGSVAAHRLDKTEGAMYPFWSPDSQYIGFFADQKLKKIAVSGVSLQTICEASGNFSATLGPGSGSGEGGAWNRDGVIVFAPSIGTPLMRVPAVGGLPTPVTSLEGGDLGHHWPQFLPDGRHILYWAPSRNSADSAIWVQELGSSKRIMVAKSMLRAAWAPPGYLLFVREGALFAQRMDPKTFQLTGEPLAIAQEVSYNQGNGRAAFAVSENGVLVYHAGLAFTARQLAWFDRQGKRLGVVGQPGEYFNLALSPDGKNVALGVGSGGSRDIWMMDLASGVLTRMTRDGNAALNMGPWSPDSKRIAVNLNPGGIRDLVVASKLDTVLATDTLEADDWLPDGSSLLCIDPVSARRLSLIPLRDGLKPHTILDTPYRQNSFRVSPDGKLVAYVSSESGGAAEVFVASFPSFAQKRQISNGGGNYPTWGKEGKELFFRQAPTSLMSVEIRNGATLDTGVPKLLFQYGTPAAGNRFMVSRDGQQFLMMDYDQKTTQTSDLIVVLNWAAELNVGQALSHAN